MREIGSALYAFMDKYLSWIDKPKIGVTDVIEIIIIAFVLYHIMVWVKNTRAWMLFKGIIVILIFLFDRSFVPDEHDPMVVGKSSKYSSHRACYHISAGAAECAGATGT